MSDSPTIHSIHKISAIAGQVQYAAVVEYPGEGRSMVAFAGSPRFGGPVVMILPRGHQTFVRDADRFGTFGPEWVRRFFGEA